MTKKKGAKGGGYRKAQASPRNPGTGTSPYGTVTFGSFSGYVTSGPTPSVTSEPMNLEVVTGGLPILAHRAAKIVVLREGLCFAAVNDSFGTFGRDADAVCRAGAGQFSWFILPRAQRQPPNAPQHPAPAVDCTCGFYAVPSDIEAQHGIGTVDLLVELSGRVIEHEKGYRASHQRVVEIQASACPYCAQPAAFACFYGASFTGFSCADHADNVTVKLCDLERVLGVPVTFEEP